MSRRCFTFRYWIEICYMNLLQGNTDQVRLYRGWPSFTKLVFLTFSVVEIFTWKLIFVFKLRNTYHYQARLLSHLTYFLCRLPSIAVHRDHFVGICLSVNPSVCLSVFLYSSHTFLVVMHSYVSQATHAFLGMLPLFCRSYCCLFKITYQDFLVQLNKALLW